MAEDRWLDRLLIQQTSTWASSRRHLGTGRPGRLQSMGLQRVRNHLATEQQQDYYYYFYDFCMSIHIWGRVFPPILACLPSLTSNDRVQW